MSATYRVKFTNSSGQSGGQAVDRREVVELIARLEKLGAGSIVVYPPNGDRWTGAEAVRRLGSN